MAPFEDWNILDDDVEEELENAFVRTCPIDATLNLIFPLQDSQGRDILLFCVDASDSMMMKARKTDDHDENESHLQSVLEIVVQLQKRKVITSPNDLVGIIFYNTVCAHFHEESICIELIK